MVYNINGRELKFTLPLKKSEHFVDQGLKVLPKKALIIPGFDQLTKNRPLSGVRQ